MSFTTSNHFICFPVPQKGEIVKNQRGRATWYMEYNGEKWKRCKKPKFFAIPSNDACLEDG